MSIREMMTPEQLAKLDQPKAWENPHRPLGFPLGATPFQMTGHFHQLMGLPAPDKPIIPSVGMRERRLRLILEEFLELTEACGFQIIFDDGLGEPLSGIDMKLQHIEGSRYDVVETADALGDLNVVVNGSGVEFGIPMHFVDYEIYTSNISKLDVEGKPIVNHCTNCGKNPNNVYESICECGNSEKFIDPSAPIGKILKPASYTAPNIPRVLLAYEDEEI